MCPVTGTFTLSFNWIYRDSKNEYHDRETVLNIFLFGRHVKMHKDQGNSKLAHNTKIKIKVELAKLEGASVQTWENKTTQS